MKIEEITNANAINFKFIAETEKEKRILGDLRTHFFYGMDDDKTYPKYDGCNIEDNYVTEIKFTMNKFKKYNKNE